MYRIWGLAWPCVASRILCPLATCAPVDQDALDLGLTMLASVLLRPKHPVGALHQRRRPLPSPRCGEPVQLGRREQSDSCFTLPPLRDGQAMLRRVHSLPPAEDRAARGTADPAPLPSSCSLDSRCRFVPLLQVQVRGIEVASFLQAIPIQDR